MNIAIDCKPSVIRKYRQLLIELAPIVSHSIADSFEYSHLPAVTDARSGNNRTDLSSALNGYEVREPAEVRNYLDHNHDLLDFLSSLPARISKSDGVESVELEFYHDIEEHWEKLYVTVNTQLDKEDELDVLEDSLYSSLFEPNNDLISGRVVLSIG